MPMSATWAAAAAPGDRRQRSRKTLNLDVHDFNAMPEYEAPARDWAELPRDALWYIFRKLDQIELLIGGAAGVCRSWRRSARGEPALWRRIDMRGQYIPYFRLHISLDAMARAALRHSAGQCEAFCAKGYVMDKLLLFLAKQAPSLKSLRLICSDDLADDAFAAAIKKFPLLEELQISKCRGIKNESMVAEIVANACPRLKHFKYDKMNGVTTDSEAMAVARMRELLTLHISPAMALDNGALTAILDNCPHLEYIDTRNCPGVADTTDKDLRAKLARIDADGCDLFEGDDPVRHFAIVWDERPNRYWKYYDDYYDPYEDEYDYLEYGVDEADLEENDYLEYGVDEADLEETAERVLDSKSMRRYLIW